MSMSRKVMVEFLSGHFRYNTMNSWNASTSYAKNIKLHHVQFPDNATLDRAYGLLGVDEAFFEFNEILRDFAENHKYEWQIGTNGRSGGYLVLYQGYMKKSGYKRECLDCGQKNYEAESKVCGYCGSENMEDYEGMETGVWGGRSTDGNEDAESFAQWDTDTLKERVKLVMDFDKTCNKAIAAFVRFCMQNKPEEKVIMVPKKVIVAVSNA